MGEVQTYELLCILDFNNVRKRMSVSAYFIRYSQATISTLVCEMYKVLHRPNFEMELPTTTQTYPFTFLLQVIVKKDGLIKLYCKGADATVFELLNAKSSDLKELTTSHLNVRCWHS